jgi:hypothetical protein
MFEVSIPGHCIINNDIECGKNRKNLSIFYFAIRCILKMHSLTNNKKYDIGSGENSFKITIIGFAIRCKLQIRAFFNP